MTEHGINIEAALNCQINGHALRVRSEPSKLILEADRLQTLRQFQSVFRRHGRRRSLAIAGDFLNAHHYEAEFRIGSTPVFKLGRSHGQLLCRFFGLRYASLHLLRLLQLWVREQRHGSG